MPTCPIVPTRINADEGGNITTASLREVLRMLAKYELCMRPGAPEIMEDYPDQFNEFSNTDLSKCRRIGLKVRYQTDWTEAALWARASAKIPTAVSVLHLGNYLAPSGPGLWILITSKGLTGYIFNTPAGVLDWTNGNNIQPGVSPTQGTTRAILRPRFCSNGPNSGHVITISE
jgi:hypothetical protein